MSVSQLLVQIFVIVIVIGGIYSLWHTTRAYGGVVGRGLRWIGIGIILFSIEALDRVLGSLSVIKTETAHNVVLLLGLLFAAVGFAKLRQVTKQK